MARFSQTIIKCCLEENDINVRLRNFEKNAEFFLIKSAMVIKFAEQETLD